MAIEQSKKKAVVQFILIVFLAFGGIYFAQHFNARPNFLVHAGETPRYRANLEQAGSAKIKEDSKKNSDYKLVSKDLSKSYPGFTLLPTSGSAEVLLLNTLVK